MVRTRTPADLFNRTSTRDDHSDKVMSENGKKHGTDVKPDQDQARRVGSQAKQQDSLLSRMVSSIAELPLLPQWLVEAAHDPDAWKLGIRCAITLWVSFIIILPEPSLRVLGNASFFAAIVAVIVAPVFPVQMYIFVAFTLLIGMCAGWAWGIAGMAASLRARSQTLLSQQIQRENASVDGESNLDQKYQVDIFNGAFLDPAASAVFGIFLASGAFFFAYVRTRAPRLAFFSIFGTIMLDALCSYGVLFPAQNYLLLQTLVISACCGVAIGIMATILVFPQTMSYLYGKSLIATLNGLRHLVELQKTTMRLDLTGETSPSSEIISQLSGQRAQVLGGIADLAQKKAMLQLECSHCRFSAEDFVSVTQKVRMCVFLGSGLRVFPEIAARWQSQFQISDNQVVVDTTITPLSINDSLRSMTDLRTKATVLEIKHGHRLQDLLPLARDASEPLLTACHEALIACIDLLHNVNTRRWAQQKTTTVERHEQQIAELRKALAFFRSQGRFAVLGPFKPFFAGQDSKVSMKDGHLPFSPRALYSLFTQQSNLIAFANGLLELFDLCIHLEKERPENRFWAPTGFQKIFRVMLDRRHNREAKLVDHASDRRSNEAMVPHATDDEEKQTLLTHRPIGPMLDQRDPDALPPANAMQHIGTRVSDLLCWLSRGEGLYCVKYAVISVCFWMPSVFANSAYINYTEKFLWGLIMAQLGLQPYISDQLAQYVPRILGTFVGGVLGMVMWYISAGNGHGNPYGLAATLGVAAFPMGFLRANVAPQQLVLVMMLEVTPMLVIGYSWIDNHLPTLSAIGAGWNVWWRRTLLVVVGLTGASIIMLLPPQSSRVRVRKGAANSLAAIIGLYCILIEGWIEEEDDHLERNHAQYIQSFQARHLEVNSGVELLKRANANASVGFGMRGPWNASAYSRLIDLEVALLEALQQLAGAFEHLDDKWRHEVLRRTAMLHPLLISETVGVGTVCSRSLLSGRPIPAGIPRHLLDRLVYYAEPKRRTSDPDSQTLTWEALADAEMQTFARAVVASFSFLAHLDDAHSVICDLVGTVNMAALSRRLGDVN